MLLALFQYVRKKLAIYYLVAERFQRASHKIPNKKYTKKPATTRRASCHPLFSYKITTEHCTYALSNSKTLALECTFNYYLFLFTLSARSVYYFCYKMNELLIYRLKALAKCVNTIDRISSIKKNHLLTLPNYRECFNYRIFTNISYTTKLQ